MIRPSTLIRHSPDQTPGRDTWQDRPWSAPLADDAYRRSVWARVLANVAVTESGCWEWTRYRNEDGYGLVSVKRRMKAVHQVALAIHLGGMWPAFLQVDHLCRNRSCCNPDHLELVTAAENTQRGLSAFTGGVMQRRKTHCPKGHPYDEANTYRQPENGHRRCRKCRAEGMRRKHQAKREGRAA